MTRNVVLLAILCAFFLCNAEGQEEQEENELSNDACLTCHGDPTFTVQDQSGKEIPLFVDPQKYALSVHGSNDCTSCHDSITEIPHAESLPKVECGTCHGDQSEIFSNSAHGQALQANKQGAPDCASCHGKHDILPKTNFQSKTHPLKQIQICSECHLKPGFPGKNVDQYAKSIHGRGLIRSGLLVSATCVSCHTAHAVLPAENPKSTVHPLNVPETCGNCHLGILDTFQHSEHGKLWKTGSPFGPGCVTCHGFHDIEDPVTTEFQLNIPLLCSNCHEEEAPTYRDSFHGKAASLGFLRSANCADCHTPHLNLSKENPRSSVHQSNLTETCGRCHSGITASFVTFDPHANPKDKQDSPLLYYVHHGMILLLIGVFGFFSVHTILWYQRTLVAKFRGELERPYSEMEGPWVMRFSLTIRILHFFIMASFLGLAFTGVPIRFSYLNWTKNLVSVLGGIEVFRFFHRFFAIITFGYAGFYIFHVLRRIIARKERRLLYGPHSMVPRGKDFQDLWQQVKWFLYVGKPAKFDRWTYWEKFDYFAVFWGIPIIGLSGLMLWFPGFFTKLLPGYILNVAQIVHGEEAMLAVGFIFIFHFFHTHLRPESFPMDLVIFTGSMPLERLKNERPEEYQRLVETGELEKHLTDPPSPQLRRFSYILGSAGLATGVILIILILISVLFFD
jgi:cytochrome b subunit of formate dehydrogenase